MLTENLRQKKRDIACNQNNLLFGIWLPVTLNGFIISTEV